MNERFNQTQPASTDGILAAEENIAFVFVYLPLRSLEMSRLSQGLLLLSSTGEHRLCPPVNPSTVPDVGPSRRDCCQPTRCQPLSLARRPGDSGGTGLLLHLPSTPFFQEEGLTWYPHPRSWCGAQALHPRFPITHSRAGTWSYSISRS